jgi:hypothetical protein
MMNMEVFSNIANIVERDSKSTTYKFALLRGVIDIAQENSPYINESGGKVYMPTGLLVYKFILYYYPVFESGKLIPQIGGKSNLAIEKPLLDFIERYKDNGGLSAFNKDLRGRGIDQNAIPSFIKLVRKTSHIIGAMPMKHIGYSLSGSHYSIFKREESGNLRGSVKQVDLKYLIDSMGTFSIPKDYFEAFKILGSFISGRDSILFKWAEFSVNASGKSIPIEAALSGMLTEPVSQRDVIQAKSFYQDLIIKNGMLNCVWTGAALKSNYHVDHVIPYAAWSNNDLWNLLPAKGAVNGNKKDKIPTPDLIERRRDDIVKCWEGLYGQYEERFSRELQVSLIGNDTLDNWQDKALERLKVSCSYLINQRGFQEWKG